MLTVKEFMYYLKLCAISALTKTYDPQGVLQCVYSLDPERNNLETLINITVEFYITQVASSSYVFYTGLFLQLFLDAPNRLNKLNIPQSMHCKTLLPVIINCPSQLLFLFNNFAFLHKNSICKIDRFIFFSKAACDHFCIEKATINLLRIYVALILIFIQNKNN